MTTVTMTATYLVDDEVERGRLLAGQVARPGALQDLVDVAGRTAKDLGRIGGVGHQPTVHDVVAVAEHARDSVFDRECDKWLAHLSLQMPHRESPGRQRAPRIRERPLEVVCGPGLEHK